MSAYGGPGSTLVKPQNLESTTHLRVSDPEALFTYDLSRSTKHPKPRYDAGQLCSLEDAHGSEELLPQLDLNGIPRLLLEYAVCVVGAVGVGQARSRTDQQPFVQLESRRR